MKQRTKDKVINGESIFFTDEEHRKRAEFR